MDKNIPGSTKFKFFSFHGRISFPLIFLGLFLLASTHAYGAVWYVDGGVTSSGGGTSWGNAFKTIQEAIDNPSTDGGDQIWVVSSAGFTPDHYFVENAIVVDKAVAIYGGFVGNEGLLEQRDWANNPTTVLGSGDGHPCFSITSDAILDGFSVTVGNNYATDVPAAVGGGIRISGSVSQIISPTIRNCRLYNNSAWFGAGIGMYYASPSIINCIFHNNIGQDISGGVYSWASSPLILNCTFYDNSSTRITGGLFIDALSSNATAINSIFWDNTFGVLYPVPGQIVSESATTTVTYSNIAAGYPGVGNINSWPFFADANGNDFHLLSGSPSIDSGDNLASGIPNLDFDGEPRLFDDLLASDTGNGTAPIADMGADEFVDTDSDTLADYVETGTGVYVGPNDTGTYPDDPDSDGDSFSDGDEVNLYGTNPNDGGDFPLPPGIMYVDDAAGDDDNSGRDSWTNAKKTIQAAVAVARVGDEIWVRAGTYTLYSDTVEATAEILVDKVVSVYGGFTGGETDRNQRDWRNNITTVSGSGIYVRGFHLTADATIDGFTVTGGIISDDSPVPSGGGILIEANHAVVQNCEITSNHAFDGGGGVAFRGPGNSSLLLNCQITHNTGGYTGPGAIKVEAGSPKIINCLISRNYAENHGGISCEGTSTPVITNCTITQNSTEYGKYGASGLLCSPYSAATVTNSIIWGNSYQNNTNIVQVIVGGASISYSNINEDGIDETGVVGTNGNISQDPLFVDPDNDNFHLQTGSPSIDAGDSNAVPIDLTEDIDGELRIAGSSVDMGVDEYHDVSYCPDTDNDGYVVSDGGCEIPEGKQASDCDDNNGAIHPEADETLCDDIDQNCNGLTDDDVNADGDSISLCDGDCNDGDNSIYPGAEETLCDGIDQNCNGNGDDDVNNDADPVSFCNGDCNDLDETIYPGANESCDGKDNDCNPATTDGSGESWLGDSCDGSDADQCPDGNKICSAGEESCDDITDEHVEIPDNGIDEDCDGSDLDTIAPALISNTPNDLETTVSVNTNIQVQLRDSGSGVILDNVNLTVNGIPITTNLTLNTVGNDFYIEYNPSIDFGTMENVNVTISADDQAGNSMSTHAFSFTTAGPGGDPWDNSDGDGDGISNSAESNILHTDPSKKTLFVRARVFSLTPEYWTDGLMALFPPPSEPANGRAYIDAFSEADIEVVVVGAPDNPYAPMANHPEYDPALDTTDFDPDTAGFQPVSVHIMTLWKYETYKAGSPLQGHTEFKVNFALPDGTLVNTWRWDTKGLTPVGGASDYWGPRVYTEPLYYYMTEGAYTQIGLNESPDGLDCSATNCNKLSPMNLGDSDTGPVYDDYPDSTVEFNTMTFNDTGMITFVGPMGEHYSNDDVLRRTLIHELGHGLHFAHCENPGCIMYHHVANWALYDLSTEPQQLMYGYGTMGPGGETCTHNAEIRAIGTIHNASAP